MKTKIIKLLYSSKGEYISGQKLSDKIDITRAGIWKHINILRKEGYIIEACSRKGYKLIEAPDTLTSEEVSTFLVTNKIGRNIIHYDTINSTNLMAKAKASLGEEEGTVIVSEEQTSGKGRMGRSWSSTKYKDIILSIILRPEIDPIHASKVTLIGAAAVLKALQEIGIPPQIKWPNDLILNNKKVCGILTEMSSELNKIHYLIIGIGINVNSDISDFKSELINSATSLKIETNKSVHRKSLMAGVLNNFEILYNELLVTHKIKSSVSICREHSTLLGKDIRIINKNKEQLAKAIELD